MPPSILAALAASFLAGKPGVEEIVTRLTVTLGRQWRWLRPLARRYCAAFAETRIPRSSEVVEFLRNDSGFRKAYARHSRRLSIAEWMTEPPVMKPVPAAESWNVPVIVSVGDLSEWLQVSADELDWFADLKGLEYKQSESQLRHYHYRLLTKKSGTLRMIEAPKPRLKELQRQILSRILENIPPHSAAHGFVKGRSIRTFAEPHMGQRVVLRMDLRDFFPSCAGVRIQTLFRTLGYPESVADLLGGICSNATPRDAWKTQDLDVDHRQLREARDFYSRPHLPQGAPTSPALANACFYRADCRLSGLAASAGALYTRYADDLAFSGGHSFQSGAQRFSIHAAAILLEEGFAVNHRKTRVMRQGVRQHLAGLVTNQHLNVIRDDYDRLKAILTNCARFGPESQNRESHPAFRSHLEGRVAFVHSINPERANRLRKLLDQIKWT